MACRATNLNILAGVGALLLVATACPPPVANTGAKPADAPPDGKQLMGGKPVAAPTVPNAAPRIPFEQAIKVTFGWDAAASAAVAQVHLEPGFHAYGPGEKTGKPLTLELTNQAWTVKEVQMPPAQQKDLGELGLSFVITGDVQVRAVVAAASDAKAPVEGRLHYQVCSETSCDRPRTAVFKLTPG